MCSTVGPRGGENLGKRDADLVHQPGVVKCGEQEVHQVHQNADGRDVRCIRVKEARVLDLQAEHPLRRSPRWVPECSSCCAGR